MVTEKSNVTIDYGLRLEPLEADMTPTVTIRARLLDS